jgi:hypothetical protein
MALPLHPLEGAGGCFGGSQDLLAIGQESGAGIQSTLRHHPIPAYTAKTRASGLAGGATNADSPRPGTIGELEGVGASQQGYPT